NTLYKCGDYVNESCVLNCSLTCQGNGLTLNADNIILDGNGYNLTGSETGIYTGIIGIKTNNKENITLKNFEISNFSNGIIPGGMHGSMKKYTIINNKLHHMTSCGISLYGASDSKIINNICHSIKLDGIDVCPGNNLTIENNTCYNNKQGGISLYGITTQNNIIKNNTLYNNNLWGIGFGWMGPNHNKILNNTIYNNTNFGIYLYYGSSFNAIYNNTIKNNKNGIFLTKCHPVANTCYTNNVINNTIAYNKILGNSAHGIYINSSTNNTIVSNKICENGVSDVAVFNGIINATGNSGDNNFCISGLNYKDISASSDNSCTYICNCSSNSECLNNKCVNNTCKSQSKNITVGLVVKFPDNSTITKCVQVPEYANGKEIFEKSGINFDVGTMGSYGYYLKCVNGTCSDGSWYWSFEMLKINETNWSPSPVVMGPGGTSNDICDSGHYCARDGDIILFNATSNAYSSTPAAPGRSVSLSEGQICKKDNNVCSNNSECLSNKCVDGICKSPIKNITVGLVIKYPNNETIKNCVKVNEYANGKEILDAAGMQINGSDNAKWGFMLSCINNNCSDESWYWGFEMHKINETNWTFMQIGMGPGGSSNNRCGANGYYCAEEGDIILFNATPNTWSLTPAPQGKSVKSYSWCKEYDFDNNNLSDIFDVVTVLEYLSEKSYYDDSEECIRKKDINLFEILKLIEKIVMN
ncbi:MAG: right-handed parallel beta-helix repeat-containing protein, partial [Candidatus Altarchaeum sp.]|nr:right-handed parallel beta-helix repeat-containing protein [Candidatus Altarchaeum sp.]